MRVSPTLIALLAASGMVGLSSSRANGSPLPDDQARVPASESLALVSELEHQGISSDLISSIPAASQLAEAPSADAPPPPTDTSSAAPLIFASPSDPVVTVSELETGATNATSNADTGADLAAEAIAQLRSQIATYQTPGAYNPDVLTTQQPTEPLDFPSGDPAPGTPAPEAPPQGEESPGEDGTPTDLPPTDTVADPETPEADPEPTPTVETGDGEPDGEIDPGAEATPAPDAEPDTPAEEPAPDASQPADGAAETDTVEPAEPGTGDEEAPADTSDTPPDQEETQVEEADPRVLVAEVAVQSTTDDLEPFLVDEVYNAIRTRPGRTTTRTQIQQDINAIFATGYFANVGARPEDTPLGVRVTFVVQPNPVLSFVRVVADSEAAAQTSDTAADLASPDNGEAEDNGEAADTAQPEDGDQSAPDQTIEPINPDSSPVTPGSPDEASPDVTSDADGNNVEVVGSTILPESVVDEIFSDQVGEIINLIDFQEGILALNEWYQEQGYVLAQVIAAPRVSDDGIVTLEIAEGVIEDIQVRFMTSEGETVNDEGELLQGRTHDYIITREFQTEPGDVFNQRQVERDFQSAFALGIFEDVQLSLEPGSDDPRKVDLVVNVTESNTGSVAAGLGFNFTGDIFGTLSYRQDNFGGNNQKLSAEAQISTRDLLFDVSFTDPWIAGDPYRTSYTASAFARRSINLNFDGGPNPIDLANGDRVRIRRLGTSLTFSRPLDNGWTLSLGTLIQNVSARDIDGRVNATDAAGNPLTASNTGIDDLWTFPFTAELDQRNDPFNPTSGSIMRLSTEQSVPLGRGSILMNRLRGSYSYYIPVSLINFTDGPQSIAFNAQVGTILGDLPPYEAFALGGTNSIRGYDEGEVGSGRSYAQFTAEYRFPLFSFLGAALFLDAGTDLGSGNAVPGAPGPSRGKPGSGFGYGAGLRVQTPLGPLRIDYGFSDQGQGRLHFGIGERF